MFKIRHDSPGGEFICRHCGSRYELTITHLPTRDKDSAICDVCGETMDSWDSTYSKSFKLIEAKKLKVSRPVVPLDGIALMPLMSFVQEGIRAVPAVRYALGVGAITAVVAIVAGFQIDLRIAVFGTVVILGLMFLLLAFAKVAKSVPAWLEPPAMIATWSFMILTIATFALLLSSYFFMWPRPINELVESSDPLASGIATGNAVGTCASDADGSAVQIFQQGWLLASFARHTHFAIWRTGEGHIGWSRTDVDFVPAETACANIDGESLLQLGFRAQYCASDAQGLRSKLGKPLAAETRAWVQYQPWSGGLLVYGLPGKVTPDDSEFQILAAAFLEGDPEQGSGKGRMKLVTVDNSQGDPYCTALWYPAQKDLSLHPKQQAHAAQCAFIVHPVKYTERRVACSMYGF